MRLTNYTTLRLVDTIEAMRKHIEALQAENEQLKADLRGKDNEINDLKALIEHLYKKKGVVFKMLMSDIWNEGNGICDVCMLPDCPGISKCGVLNKIENDSHSKLLDETERLAEDKEVE